MKKEKGLTRRSTTEGFIGIIILVVVTLALFKYFLDWSVFEAAATPQGQETISYSEKVISTIWHYLSIPVLFIWHKIIWPLLAFIRPVR